MALSRICSVSAIKHFLSKLSFTPENEQFSVTSKYVHWKPILSSNLPCLMCVSGKKTVAQELQLPEPPKKPMASFLRHYIQEIKKYPAMSVKERAVRVSHEWDTLDALKKSSYINAYNTELEIYRKKHKEYIEGLSADDLEKIKCLKQKRKNEKKVLMQRRNASKEAEMFGKPKHPGTVFTLFIDSLKEKNYSKETEVWKKSAEKWRSLPEDMKESFKEECRKRLSHYKMELAEWELKMEEKGRGDLVQRRTLKSESVASKNN